MSVVKRNPVYLTLQMFYKRNVQNGWISKIGLLTFFLILAALFNVLGAELYHFIADAKV